MTDKHNHDKCHGHDDKSESKESAAERKDKQSGTACKSEHEKAMFAAA